MRCYKPYDGDFPLNPITKTQRMLPGHGRGQPECELARCTASGSVPCVIESSPDQSWTDFCGALNGNAFLLAESGFADLEPS